MRSEQRYHRRTTLLLVETIRFWTVYVAGIVSGLPEIDYLGCVNNGTDALKLCTSAKPTMVMLGDELDDCDGYVCAAKIRTTSAKTKIVIFTTRNDPTALHYYDRMPLDGMISKDFVSETSFASALSNIRMGLRYIAPELETIHRQYRANPNAWWKILSDREQSLLPMLGLGMTDPEIAHKTKAESSTIRVHRQNIMRKLNLHKNTELIRWALTEGFVTMRMMQSH